MLWRHFVLNRGKPGTRLAIEAQDVLFAANISVAVVSGETAEAAPHHRSIGSVDLPTPNQTWLCQPKLSPQQQQLLQSATWAESVGRISSHDFQLITNVSVVDLHSPASNDAVFNAERLRHLQYCNTPPPSRGGSFLPKEALMLQVELVTEALACPLTNN